MLKYFALTFAKQVFTAFLQVRENWKKSGNLCCQGKIREKYYFFKSQGK